MISFRHTYTRSSRPVPTGTNPINDIRLDGQLIIEDDTQRCQYLRNLNNGGRIRIYYEPPPISRG